MKTILNLFAGMVLAVAALAYPSQANATVDGDYFSYNFYWHENHTPWVVTGFHVDEYSGDVAFCAMETYWPTGFLSLRMSLPDNEEPELYMVFNSDDLLDSSYIHKGHQDISTAMVVFYDKNQQVVDSGEMFYFSVDEYTVDFAGLSPLFLQEVVKNHYMSVFSGNYLTFLTLEGTAAAYGKMYDCVDAYFAEFD